VIEASFELVPVPRLCAGSLWDALGIFKISRISAKKGCRQSQGIVLMEYDGIWL
jgi:hypothetical protein